MRQIEDRMLQVCYEDRLVGTMVLTADRKAAFEFAAAEKAGICAEKRLFRRAVWNICR